MIALFFELRRQRRRAVGIATGLGLAAASTSCGFLPFSTMSLAGTEILERAPKPAPVDSAFDGCGEAGSQPDYAINRRKNRVDEGQYIPVPWRVIARLPWPRRVGYRFRHQWTRGETREVARFEGVAVEVEGYLTDYSLEGPEPPNCYSTTPRNRDHHLWLSENPQQSKRQSIIVEFTPRVRVSHPGWTDDRLAAAVNMRPRLRVRGWLMLDQMHPESIGGVRTTLWEIHPIMQLDWQSSRGIWISLDSLSPVADTGLARSR